LAEDDGNNEDAGRGADGEAEELVPIAIASSRKISGAVAMIHWIVFIMAFPPGRFLGSDLWVGIPGFD
jgi:hypothetical protein